MKKLDVQSFLALFLGAGVVSATHFLEGGNVAFLINIPALVIVVGGSITACLLEFSQKDILNAIRGFRYVVFPPKIVQPALIEELAQISRLARQNGMLSLENKINDTKHPIIKRGLTLLVDGISTLQTKDVLLKESSFVTHNIRRSGQLFTSLGGYSPTMGIIGAVIGLMQVMTQLNEPEKIGVGIAVAFIATIYGIGFANFFFLPIGNKLIHIADRMDNYNQLIIEGVVSIGSGDNPQLIRNKLSVMAYE